MIGISTKNALKQGHWIDGLAKNGFRLIEINHRITLIEFSEHQIKHLLDLKKKNNAIFTLHSGVSDLLHPDKTVSKYQELLLKTEIKYAPVLGIKYIVFHFPDYVEHVKNRKRIHAFLRDILKYADKYRVNLLIENNSRGPWSKPEDFLPYFRKYRSLKHVLDIGHLNRAVAHGNIESEEHYLKMLGRYVMYVHIHGNNGKMDSHGALDEKGMKLNILLPGIKRIRPKIMIIETRRIEDALRTRKILNKYGIN